MNNSMNKGIEISVPKKYCCPISGEIMAEPVCTMDGQTYDRKYIEEWLFKNKKDTSPATNETLTSKKIIPNWSLNSIISEYVECNHQFQDEYDKQKDISKLWHLERKKYAPLGNSKALGAIEYPALPHKLFDILYKKINETVNLLNYYRDLNQDYFISWLVESYKLYTIEVELFIEDICRKEELELFLENNQAFYYLTKDFDIKDIISLTPKTVSKWLLFIKDKITTHSKFKKNIIFKEKLHQLNLTLVSIEEWEDESNQFNLLGYLLENSTNVSQLIEEGNFSLPNEELESVPALHQLKLIKNDKNVEGFFKKAFQHFCEGFLQLIAKDQASIPWYKWIDLWRNEQNIAYNKEKVFDQILAIEKRGDCPKFSTFIKNIKAHWFKNNSELINDFHKNVSLQSLLHYYESSSKNEKNNILHHTRTESIYGYLNTRKITPAQALQWFFDPELKPKIPPLYVTDRYGTAPILSFKDRLKEFWIYQQNQHNNGIMSQNRHHSENKENAPMNNRPSIISISTQEKKKLFQSNDHSYEQNTPPINVSNDYSQHPTRYPLLTKTYACMIAFYCLGGLSGIGGETYHLLSQYQMFHSNKPLAIGLLAAAFFLLLIGFIVQLTTKVKPSKQQHFCCLKTLAHIIFFGGVLSVAGSATSLYFDCNELNLILFIASASLIMIGTVSTLLMNHFSPKQNNDPPVKLK
jgi:hypothetical protein